MQQSANSVWLDLLTKIRDNGSQVSPRGINCQEILQNTTIVDMKSPVVTVKRRKLGRRFLVAEAHWILSGKNDVASISPYSKEISKFSNDGRTFDGAYGPKIVDQLRYVCDTLVEDKDTRQAVISIWRENPRKSKDVPCTIACQFFIRERQGTFYLDCSDYMRSSDAWLGVVYDWFNFSMLSAYVLLSLRSRDNFFWGVELGLLRLTAGSQHIYESNFQDAAGCLIDTSYDEYEKFDVDEFASPEDLLDHLARLKDREKAKRSWLAELMPTEVGA